MNTLTAGQLLAMFQADRISRMSDKEFNAHIRKRVRAK